MSLRLGLDPVHTTRVATRRLRSTLRVFGELFDSAAAERLDGELAWYAQLLGQVRDPQVQRARFAAAVGSLPPDLVLGPVVAHIEERLLSEQLHHHDQLMAALDTARYRELSATVASWASDPPLTVPVAEDPDGLFRLARKADRKAHRRLRTGLASGDDLALHRARKAAKRSRYAAELVAPLPGAKAAKAAIKHHKKVQTVLGDTRTASSPWICCIASAPRQAPPGGKTASPTDCSTPTNKPRPGEATQPSPTSPADQRCSTTVHLAHTSSNPTSPGPTPNPSPRRSRPRSTNGCEQRRPTMSNSTDQRRSHGRRDRRRPPRTRRPSPPTTRICRRNVPLVAPGRRDSPENGA